MSWTLRTATAADHDRVVAVVDDWWGGRSMSGLLQPLFLDHFSSTSLVAEGSDGALAGFLIGFVSIDDPTTAYVHFMGVAPSQRGRGLGAALYRRFDTVVAPLGARRIRCVTSVVNDESVAFHQAIGFSITGRTIDRSVDGGGYVHLERLVQDPPSPNGGEAVWPPPTDTVLVGRTLRARPTQSSDAPALFAALDDAAVWRHLTWPQPRSSADMSRVVDVAIRSMFPWTLTLQREVRGLPLGTVIGWSSFLDVSVHDARLEIGATCYDPRVWASEVNPEAKLLLLGHAFDDLGFGRVQLKTDIRNHRSQDAIARLGATREGILRRYQRRVDGTVRDTVVYSITAGEWPGVRARLEDRLKAVD